MKTINVLSTGFLDALRVFDAEAQRHGTPGFLSIRLNYGPGGERRGATVRRADGACFSLASS